MPLLWLLLPLAAAGIYFASRAGASADQADTSGDAAADDGELRPLLAWGIPQSVADAGSAIVESVTVAVKSQSGTLGIRNNNPGNIRASGIKWQGESGTNGGFEVFATAVDGIRALARNLMAYQVKHGDTTIEQIISRWAPPNENNTAAYIAAVSAETGIKPRENVNMKDAGTLTAITRAIIRHENGGNPYDAATIDTAVSKALG